MVINSKSDDGWFLWLQLLMGPPNGEGILLLRLNRRKCVKNCSYMSLVGMSGKREKTAVTTVCYLNNFRVVFVNGNILTPSREGAPLQQKSIQVTALHSPVKRRKPPPRQEAPRTVKYIEPGARKQVEGGGGSTPNLGNTLRQSSSNTMARLGSTSLTYFLHLVHFA